MPTESEQKEILEALGPEYTGSGQDAWESLAWSWQYRWGAPLQSRYGASFVRQADVERTIERTHGMRFSQTPADVCWIVPEFWSDSIDGQFVNEWVETGHPRIIFNHRDPRDSFISMVNFLDGATAEGFGKFSEFQIHARILSQYDSLDEKVHVALTDPAFPLRQDFRRAYWLLRHPDVLSISFEELVGARGGGSDEAQAAAIRRIAGHLDAEHLTAQLESALYNTSSFSFHRGQIGAWRTTVSGPVQAELTEAFGEELEAFGYIS